MVVIAKPDAHHRTYSFVELDNGVKAVLGSDSECDKAGAALCVNVGMCHERKDLPGLAHFLEHMLFTGTAKYPKEGEYHEFIGQNGGSANAYTTCYFTNYMFDIKPDMLEQALDRFAGFFTEPLLSKDCTMREINAVDSEFQGGFTEPWWRYVGIMNMSANPDHPFHVAVGNLKVLRDEPKERGIDLYDEMKILYESTYSANGMTVCVFGKESNAELETLVREKFGGVVNKGLTMPIGDTVSEKPPFLPNDWNRLLLQNPVKDIKELVFSWVIAYQGPSWQCKPTAYISHLIGHEGAGSVISVLKQKGWISGCMSGDGGWLEGAFSLFNVTFELTDAGLDKTEEIGIHLFAYIGMLQKTPVEQWIFDELRKLRQIQFKFGEDAQPFELCPEMAMSLQRMPPEEVLAGNMLLYDYRAEEISSILSKLTLDSVRVSLQAKCFADRCTEKDTSYDSPMAFLPLENEWLSQWKAALNPGDGSPTAAVKAAAAMGVHLPKPNPFVPEDLSLKQLPSKSVPLPRRLEAPPPVTCIFHRQDDEFKQPKAYVCFVIYSWFLQKTVESCTRSELWCRAVKESLNEYAYDAEMAGVSYNLALMSGAIKLTFAGFNDKLPVLLKAVTEKIRSLTEIPENIYSIVLDSYTDDLRNAAFKSPPYNQCSMRFNELTTRGFVFPSYQKYEALQSLTRESLSDLAALIFDECHVEAMILGNATKEDALRYAEAFNEGLKIKKSLASLPPREEAVLPAGNTLWTLDHTNDMDPNNAVFLRIQIPESVKNDVLLGLLNNVLSPKFFDILRTQQQLGYIVSMGNSAAAKFCYLYCVIQTEFPADYVRGRIDAFLTEHFAFVGEKLTEEEFETCRVGLLSEYKVKPKSLQEEYGRYSKELTNRSYAFERRQQAIDFLEDTTAASLVALKAFVKEVVASSPRIYNQVKKTLAKADKDLPEGGVLPDDAPELRKWDSHQGAIQAFTPMAEWLALNAEVPHSSTPGSGGYSAKM